MKMVKKLPLGIACRSFATLMFWTLVVIGSMSSLALGQQIYTHEKVDYSFELPSASWKTIVEPDDTHKHPEFIYGGRLDGYLTIRKEAVASGTDLNDFLRNDVDLKLRYLPGFVEGKQENVTGSLNGVTFSYEFVRGGKPMQGRVYYLQADPSTVYVLSFTGLRDKLNRIRNQTDLIARTFDLE